MIVAIIGSGGFATWFGLWLKTRAEQEKQRRDHELNLLKLQVAERERTLEIVRESQNGKMRQLIEMMTKVTEIQTNLVVMQRDIQSSVGRIAAALEARPCDHQVEAAKTK